MHMHVHMYKQTVQSVCQLTIRGFSVEFIKKMHTLHVGCEHMVMSLEGFDGDTDGEPDIFH